MLSKLDTPLKPKVDLIFLDTLYHFKETLSLVDRVKERYPNTKLHVYKPEGIDNVEEFEAKHGQKLWESNDEYYDWVAKVEPAQRANAELNVKALLTGRRRSQGGKRGDLDILEASDDGIIKVNPLANWSFKQVKDYIDEHNVPYNILLDQGYKSVGDWHSTQPVKAGEDERAGRWAGKDKTECGIHNKKSRYAQYLMEQEAKRQQEELSKALGSADLNAPTLTQLISS
jgi:phosphoadenosine phosphosulfate reductase